MKKIIYIPILLFFLTISSYGAEKEFGPQIEKIITSQFNAFQEKNLLLAYSFASPEIKRRYPSAEIFGQMVKNGYSDIWNSKSHTFEGLKINGEMAFQMVTVISNNNTINNYLYTLYDYNGEWVIAGVTRYRSDSMGI
tara:strand:+ start:539 stop:952 length:414 start_codon:yes stop_codon:yes gene_type:complete